MFCHIKKYKHAAGGGHIQLCLEMVHFGKAPGGAPQKETGFEGLSWMRQMDCVSSM